MAHFIKEGNIISIKTIPKVTGAGVTIHFSHLGSPFRILFPDEVQPKG